MKRTLSIIFLLALSLLLIACSEWTPDMLWADATYSEDAELGDGAKTITVDIVAGEKSLTLTIHTDKDTLSEALTEFGLVNHPSFFDTLCGMKADYAEHGVYWAFFDDGQYASYGIDEATILGGEAFSFVCQRG